MWRSMGSSISLFLAILLAADPQTAAAGAPPPSAEMSEEAGLATSEPKAGAGVSPVELIPRLELRQEFERLEGGVSVHDTVAEVDIQFYNRILLRYEGTVRVLSTPAGQVSGFGDLRIQAITVVGSDPSYVAAVIVGGVLDTASQPPLGAGKQQLFFGGAAALKPYRWWLPYLVILEQISLGGDSGRPDVNFLDVRIGNIVFGPGYAWYKLDLDVVGDFAAGQGRFFGTLEMGRLLIGRVGLFTRAGTQLLGTRQLQYSLSAGVRYLFRLGKGSI